jgi:hypothetical protein
MLASTRAPQTNCRRTSGCQCLVKTLLQWIPAKNGIGPIPGCAVELGPLGRCPRPLPRAPTLKTVPSSASTWLFGDAGRSSARLSSTSSPFRSDASSRRFARSKAAGLARRMHRPLMLSRLTRHPTWHRPQLFSPCWGLGPDLILQEVGTSTHSPRGAPPGFGQARQRAHARDVDARRAP